MLALTFSAAAHVTSPDSLLLLEQGGLILVRGLFIIVGTLVAFWRSHDDDGRSRDGKQGVVVGVE